MSQSDPTARKPLHLLVLTHNHRHGTDTDLFSHRGHDMLYETDLAFSDPDRFELYRDDERLEVEAVPKPLNDLLRYAERRAAAGCPEATEILQRIEGPEFNRYLQLTEGKPYRTCEDVMREHQADGAVQVVLEGHAETQWGESYDLAGAKIVDAPGAYLVQLANGQHEIFADLDTQIVSYAETEQGTDLDAAIKENPNPAPSRSSSPS